MSRSPARLGLLVGAILLGAGLLWLNRTSAPPAARATTVRPPRPLPAETPPPAAIAHGTEAMLSRLRRQTLPEALQRPGASTVGDAFEAIAQMEDSAERTQWFQAILRDVLGRDPIAAAELADALTDPKLRRIGVGFVLTEWGARDPANALRWAVTRPDREADGFNFFMAYEGFAARDAGAALRWLRHPEFAPDIDTLSRIVVGQFHAQQRLAEARAEIEKLPEGALRDLLARRVVATWAETAPADAANWLAATASDATFRAGMGELVRTLAERDPRFAAGLTQQFSDPKIRGDFLADAIYLWARSDLGGAGAWLRAQPPAPHLDAAMARMAEATAKFDPVEAAAWVDRVQDTVRREELRKQLGR